VYTLATRTPMRVDVIRDRGALGREVPGGLIENVFRLQVINTSEESMELQLSVSGLEGARITLTENGSDRIHVDAAANKLLPVVVQVPVNSAKPGLYDISHQAVGEHENGQKTYVNERSSFYIPQ